MKIDFDLALRECRVSLDNGSDLFVAAKGVRSLHGALIRHESVQLVRRQPPAIALLSARMADWGAPSTQQLFRHLYDEEINESVVHALAVRAADVSEILYLVADSFNFRTALGDDSTSVTEQNLRLLVKRLGALAPHATHDAFVAAFTRSLPLPPPVGSLMEFLWYVARSEPLP